MNSKLVHFTSNLPEIVRNAILNSGEDIKDNIEEVRLRCGMPIIIILNNIEYYVDISEHLIKDNSYAVNCSRNMINEMLNKITNYSYYAHKETINNLYITVSGGHRVGLSGKVIFSENKIQNVNEISSLNIRYSKEYINISNELMSYIIKTKNEIFNTLIISAPQCGKTTLIRDIVRNLSDGYDIFQGQNVSIVDERSEIAAMYEGRPSNYVGIRTDILDNCLKSEGINLMLRSMSPKVIALDEISTKEDFLSIENAINSGVNIVATIHGYNYEDIKTRYSRIDKLNNTKFERIIELEKENGLRIIKKIYDEEQNNILQGKEIVL